MGIYSDWTVKNTGKEGVLVNAEFVLKMLDKVIDIIYPVGFYYIQFAGKNNDFLDDERPQSLFSGTSWQQLWSGEGVYFQTEGGGSMLRANGLQEDAVRNIAGTAIGSLNSDIDPFWGATAPFYLEGQSSHNRSVNWEYNSQGGYGSVKMDISRSVPTDTRNHPRNRLVKVWKRVQ
jgi:hypothetical protein